MKIAALFHVPFEKLGYIEDWIIEKGHVCSEIHLYSGTPLPAAKDFDMLIIMGGSMGIHDDADYPWLEKEKALISDWIESGKPLLGICLGSQLIASVLGSRVYPGKYKEIGWFPITMNRKKAITSHFPDMPESIKVFHWHGDTFDLPRDSVSLASSEITRSQGFLYRHHVLALQFHCEIKPENVSLMINHAGRELVPGPYVQDEGALSSGLVYMPENNKLMNMFLNYFENLVELNSDDDRS